MVTICILFVGLLLNACLISILGLILIDAESLSNQRAKKMDASDKFLDTHHLPVDLKRQIKEFHLYQWSRTHGLDARQFVASMSDDLADSIFSHIYQDLLDEVPIIKEAPPEFKQRLCHLIKPSQFQPGATVIKVRRFGVVKIDDVHVFSPAFCLLCVCGM